MRLAAAVGLGLLAALSIGLGASQLIRQPIPRTPELAVETQLRCPQCTGIRLDVCDRQICADMREDIRRRLAAGESPKAIVAAYEGAYGPGVLEEPSGLDRATAWLPWLAVVVGLLVLIAVAAAGRSLKRGPPTGAFRSDLVDQEMARWREGT